MWGTWDWDLTNISDWSFGGVDHTIQGNGGPACTDFLSPDRRVYETILATVLGISYILWGYINVKVPLVPNVERQDRGGKRALLVTICLIFGMEIGFKFASRTVIYILNPCHIITVIQIFLLAAPPTSKLVTILFRIQMHCLHGAALAIVFPVLNTRLLPMESETYWVQHIMMLVIPFYLLRTGLNGVYTVEPIFDMSWNVLTLGSMFLYHFLLLQGLGMVTEVNLNGMICPAVSDPFYGQNYRLWALGHQTVLILTIGKLYTLTSLGVLRALGVIYWTGEKYVTMATLRVQQLCSMCKETVQNGCSALKCDDKIVHNE